MTQIKKSIAKATRFSLRLLGQLTASLAGISIAIAEEASQKITTPGLLQWTNSIDMRAAFITSAISLIILFAVGKTDFKSPFGIWGGRFIILVLVILNIALWSAQI